MFKRRAAGYTIFETMIFLAVSGVILSAAILLFQGQQGKTQFDQSVRDFNSKLEQYVGDVNGGFFPGSNNYGCFVGAGNRPALNNNPQGLGANTSCIFLGKVIGLTLNGSMVYVYTVLGDRVDPLNPPNLVTTISGAFPEPANKPGFDLTESYQFLGGTVVKSATAISTSGNTFNHTTTAGFFNDLSGNSTGGSQAVAAYGYNVNNISGITNDIRQTGQSGSNSFLLQTWDICLQGGSGSQTALLQVNVTGLGITTKLIFGGC